MTTTLIRGGAGAGKWQERLCVGEEPHDASTIAAKVWQWLLKSEERDNRATYGLIHQRSGDDDHTLYTDSGFIEMALPTEEISTVSVAAGRFKTEPHSKKRVDL